MHELHSDGGRWVTAQLQAPGQQAPRCCDLCGWSGRKPLHSRLEHGNLQQPGSLRYAPWRRSHAHSRGRALSLTEHASGITLTGVSQSARLELADRRPLGHPASTRSARHCGGSSLSPEPPPGGCSAEAGSPQSQPAPQQSSLLVAPAASSGDGASGQRRFQDDGVSLFCAASAADRAHAWKAAAALCCLSACPLMTAGRARATANFTSCSGLSANAP